MYVIIYYNWLFTPYVTTNDRWDKRATCHVSAQALGCSLSTHFICALFYRIKEAITNLGLTRDWHKSISDKSTRDDML